MTSQKKLRGRALTYSMYHANLNSSKTDDSQRVSYPLGVMGQQITYLLLTLEGILMTVISQLIASNRLKSPFLWSPLLILLIHNFNNLSTASQGK